MSQRNYVGLALKIEIFIKIFDTKQIFLKMVLDSPGKNYNLKKVFLSLVTHKKNCVISFSCAPTSLKITANVHSQILHTIAKLKRIELSQKTYTSNTYIYIYIYYMYIYIYKQGKE